MDEIERKLTGITRSIDRAQELNTGGIHSNPYEQLGILIDQYREMTQVMRMLSGRLLEVTKEVHSLKTEEELNFKTIFEM